ncbi:DUF305 domain-containing protein [Brevundimonas sp. LM2]|uniref:DUF305 domain-containing protein n=1 Tax=Brevundimonas sp. LM2 TaxID=1938605 RepID=UPI0012371FFD|nr:DUF305 domain-containing protein [Brevundimonas sp. LM2]
MHPLLGIVLAGVVGLPQDAPTPPIFQPGAPGTAARTITPAQAVELSRTSCTADDVEFMQHMLVHHGQAVEMVALLQAHGDSPQIKRLGQRIALSQAAEMALIRNWLTDRGQPVAMTMADLHAGHSMAHAMAMETSADDVALMPGMLTPNQMKTLAAARGPAFDRLFLEGMIRHHQGALGMVEALLAQTDAAQDPMLSDFATSVVADQSAEILRMQSLLSDL